jgi:hypothetical protein
VCKVGHVFPQDPLELFKKFSSPSCHSCCYKSKEACCQRLGLIWLSLAISRTLEVCLVYTVGHVFHWSRFKAFPSPSCQRSCYMSKEACCQRLGVIWISLAISRSLEVRLVYTVGHVFHWSRFKAFPSPSCQSSC